MPTPLHASSSIIGEPYKVNPTASGSAAILHEIPEGKTQKVSIKGKNIDAVNDVTLFWQVADNTAVGEWESYVFPANIKGQNVDTCIMLEDFIAGRAGQGNSRIVVYASAADKVLLKVEAIEV